MRKVLYGGHINSSKSCSSYKCNGKGCPCCKHKGKPQMQIGSRRKIGSSVADKRPSLISPASSLPSKGYIQKCQDIKDQNLCNRSQILTAENLPTTSQLTLQTCGYYPPNDTCYPIESPANLTKIINVDPNIPNLINAMYELN